MRYCFLATALFSAAHALPAVTTSGVPLHEGGSHSSLTERTQENRLPQLEPSGKQECLLNDESCLGSEMYCLHWLNTGYNSEDACREARGLLPKQESAGSAGGSSPNNHKATEGINDKGDNVVFPERLPWQRKPHQSNDGQSAPKPGKPSTTGQTPSSDGKQSSQPGQPGQQQNAAPGGAVLSIRGAGSTNQVNQNQENDQSSSIQSLSSNRQDNVRPGQPEAARGVGEGKPYDEQAYNNIVNAENSAYDQMRQEWNNGNYVPGVDGFDDNNNPVFGDRGDYDAAVSESRS